VERTALVPKALLVGAQTAEIFGGLWHDIGAQQHDDATHVAGAYPDVEVNLWVGFFLLRRLFGHRFIGNRFLATFL
jgi:hypothetical protein